MNELFNVYKGVYRAALALAGSAKYGWYVTVSTKKLLKWIKAKKILFWFKAHFVHFFFKVNFWKHGCGAVVAAINLI